MHPRIPLAFLAATRHAGGRSEAAALGGAALETLESCLDPTDRFAPSHAIFLGVFQPAAKGFAARGLPCPVPVALRCGHHPPPARGTSSDLPQKHCLHSRRLESTTFLKEKTSQERNRAVFDIYKSLKPSRCWCQDEQDSSSRGRGRSSLLQPRPPRSDHFGLARRA